MPAAAAVHVALAPAPPDSPPPPVQPEPLEELEDELVLDEALVLLLHVDDRVDGRVDHVSTSFPNPNASSHGYQLSRSAGSGFSSSVSKYRRPAVSRLRKAIASRLCRDFKALIDAFEMHITHAAIPRDQRPRELEPAGCRRSSTGTRRRPHSRAERESSILRRRPRRGPFARGTASLESAAGCRRK